jgi:sRNA-binding protein
LDLWIRILSQAEHTQRLVQSTHWDGASNEQAAIEAEAFARQQEARRRAEEARERAAAREREAAAAEAKRLAAEKKPAGRGTRRGVPATRGTSGTSGRGASSSSGYGSSSSSTRGAPASRLTRGSGIGRGVFGSSRGARGRGTGS